MNKHMVWTARPYDMDHPDGQWLIQEVVGGRTVAEWLEREDAEAIVAAHNFLDHEGELPSSWTLSGLLFMVDMKLVGLLWYQNKDIQGQEHMGSTRGTLRNVRLLSGSKEPLP